MHLVGVDVGGTFTDLVHFGAADGTTHVHKAPTTPDNPARGVLEGILELCRRFDIDPGVIDHVYHGTTTATNAILEHDGAECGMITNEGYRDILHIGRHQRPQHFSIQQEIPWQDRPLIRRRHRLTVPHRIAPPRGEVLVPLDEDAVRRAARQLRAAGVEAVAVCFLFSYLDPAHEARARAIVEEEFPGAFVTCSAEVSPQFREFERFTTTAMNAFVGPKMRRYLTDLAEGLGRAGLKADLHIMASNGGVATAQMVAARPVMTLLSGPAAGVLGGRWAGALSGRDNLITFDVGGTSADIGIVRAGSFAEASPRDTWIAGFPLMVPMIDIHTIGAGGGSIAWVDAGGAFRVGPRSAGARPGPAAYGHGGTEPTVTDANVVLGRLDPGNFLGGEMRLDPAAAEAAIDRLAGRLGLDRLTAAEGVLTIVNANMANAIRSRTVQRGLDPRDFTLVAFGGAGPMQAAEVAAMLSIPEVIVPPHPGITSATGLLTTDLKYDAIRTAFQVSGQIEHRQITRALEEMEAGLAAQFAADGIGPDRVRFQRAADLRYVGQGYELRVPVPAGAFDAAAEAALFARFEQLHREEYGRAFPGAPKEIVNLRVTGFGETVKIRPAPRPTGGSLDAARIRVAPVVFRTGDGLAAHQTAFYRRDLLPADTPIPGPAVIVQQDSTTILRPGDSFHVDQAGNILIRIAT
ncbi:MAG: methylhydantoinase [Paracoccaceae bacterium]|nr:MAG: methylhydantoinase [Paracoccaceae bacterium]